MTFACALQAIQKSQRDHANNSLIDDIPTFDSKPKLFSNWTLKCEKIAAVAK